MKTYDQKAAAVLSQWTEREFRATLRAKPRSEVKEHNDFAPSGPHRWLIEALADISAILALRQMSETWRSNPPYLSWRSCAAGIRQKADEMVLAARLLPGISLAEWFAENEGLLQQDTTQARTRVVAVALLPLFELESDCWAACEHLDDDTHGTFAEYLQDWHARAPEKHRSFIRQIAGEFGLEIEEKTATGSR